MKRLAGAVLAVFLVQCFSFAQQTQKGSIEGVVVRAGTADVVAGAQVTLNRTFVPGGGPGGTTGAIAGGVVAGVVGGVASTGQTPPPPAASVPAQIVPLLPAAIPPVTTDNSGKFSFKNLDAGAYRIMVAANGYVRQEYGQRALNGQGTPVFLTAGQTLQDLAVRLIPAGTVRGRILEESGQPAWGAPVQLLRVAY